MDQQVLAAMARWPNVPDVYGWLSLSTTGQWRIHPRGTAWRCEADPLDGLSSDDILGEAITNAQLTAFIGRNYAHDDCGQWYFQNGPQRVYVRLDAAPYLLRTDRDESGRIALRTHVGDIFSDVEAWWLDEHGRLFAHKAPGAGMVLGRDLPDLMAHLYTASGPLIDVLAEARPGVEPIRIGRSPPPFVGSAPLRRAPYAELPAALGFIAYPRP